MPLPTTLPYPTSSCAAIADLAGQLTNAGYGALCRLSVGTRQFVHIAELVLEVGELRKWSIDSNRITEAVMPVLLLMSAFEEELVAYFREE